jgi:hypothetical protein
MKRIIAVLMLIASTGHLFAQSSATYLKVRVIDSIRLGEKTVRAFSTDVNLSDSADNILPTQSAVKGAIAKGKVSLLDSLANRYTKEQLFASGQAAISADNILDAPWLTAESSELGMFEQFANKSNATSLGTSDILYPTQNAVKVYLDNSLAGQKSIYTSDGILSGTRKLTGKQRTYGLAFDSLTSFTVQGTLLSFVAKNPAFNNAQISFSLQGGQSNWRAFSVAGTVTADVEVGQGVFRAMVDGNTIIVNGDSELRPGLVLSGGVHVDINSTSAASYTIGAKGYFLDANTSFNSVSVNLPNSTPGRILIIKKTNAANSLTVVPAGSNTIDGQASIVLTENGAVLRLIGAGGWKTF